MEFLISIDIAGPGVKDVIKTAGITGDTVDKFLKYETMESNSVPSYSYEEALQIVEDAYNGSITKESAIILMKRGTRSTCDSGRYCFSRDARLKVTNVICYFIINIIKSIIYIHINVLIFNCSGFYVRYVIHGFSACLCESNKMCLS